MSSAKKINDRSLAKCSISLRDDFSYVPYCYDRLYAVVTLPRYEAVSKRDDGAYV